MQRLLKHWWAIPAAVMALLLALIFRPELRSLFGEPAASATPVAEPTSPSASVGEPVPPPSAAPSRAQAAPPRPPPESPKPPAAPRPTEIDGQDADTWRNVLRGAVDRGDAAIAADAFLALAQIDPERFAQRRVFRDGVTAAHLAATTTASIADRVFGVLASDALGAYGPDILYRLTSIHGGSRAAKRAAELLKNDDVLKHATPGMRVALEIRDAPCKSRPALFDRAAREGDERTLYLLQAMRSAGCGQISCCMRGDAALDAAMSGIRARLADSR